MHYNITILDGVTTPNLSLSLQFPYSLTEYELCSDEKVEAALEGQHIVITNKVKITREHMLKNPQLKMIAIAATGFDHIDIKAAEEFGVRVMNVKNYSTRAVAEHTLMMMLSLSHQLLPYHRKVIKGEWQHSSFFSINGPSYQELGGKTLAILGKGDTGMAVADLAAAFDMNVLFSERKGVKKCRKGYILFDEAIRYADIVTLHCPLNEETKDTIAANEFEQMKPTAFLINIGRGGLVNEHDLVNALKEKKIAGAGFDVLSIEPPVVDNPLLSTLDNLILTPHIACRSDESFRKLYSGLSENLNAFVNNQLINVVI